MEWLFLFGPFLLCFRVSPCLCDCPATSTCASPNTLFLWFMLVPLYPLFSLARSFLWISFHHPSSPSIFPLFLLFFFVHLFLSLVFLCSSCSRELFLLPISHISSQSSVLLVSPLFILQFHAILHLLSQIFLSSCLSSQALPSASSSFSSLAPEGDLFAVFSLSFSCMSPLSPVSLFREL